MSLNGFSTGRDISLVVTTPNGQLTLVGLTNFSKKPMTTKIKSKGIDGTPRHATIPDGWSGSFRLDRLSPEVDNFWAAFEAGYFNGQSQQGGAIYETISESDGSVTQWRYVNVALSLDDAGDFAGDKRVEQSISFEADRRIKVA